MEGPCVVDQDIHLIHQGEQWIDYQISFRKLSMLSFVCTRTRVANTSSIPTSEEWTTAGFEPHKLRCNNVPDRYSCTNTTGGGVCHADPNGTFIDKAACLPVCMPHVHEKLVPCNESMQTLKYCDVRTQAPQSPTWVPLHVVSASARDMGSWAVL